MDSHLFIHRGFLLFFLSVRKRSGLYVRARVFSGYAVRLGGGSAAVIPTVLCSTDRSV